MVRTDKHQSDLSEDDFAALVVAELEKMARVRRLTCEEIALLNESRGIAARKEHSDV